MYLVNLIEPNGKILYMNIYSSSTFKSIVRHYRGLMKTSRLHEDALLLVKCLSRISQVVSALEVEC